MPDQDSTAAVAGDDGHQDRTIETLFGYAASTITVVDQRCMVLSFNTSGISAAPSSATLKIFGKTILFLFKSILLKTIPVFGSEGHILIETSFPV